MGGLFLCQLVLQLIELGEGSEGDGYLVQEQEGFFNGLEIVALRGGCIFHKDGRIEFPVLVLLSFRGRFGFSRDACGIFFS